MLNSYEYIPLRKANKLHSIPVTIKYHFPA